MHFQLVSSIGYETGKDINTKVKRVQQFYETIKYTLLGKCQNETLPNPYIVTTIPMLLNGSECWMLMKEQMRMMKTAEMNFLSVIAGYRIMDNKLMKYQTRSRDNRYQYYQRNG
jgi:hypothetical protein